MPTDPAAPCPWETCPFCGGSVDPKGWIGHKLDPDAPNGLGEEYFGPECESCGATAPDQETWNRRVTAVNVQSAPAAPRPTHQDIAHFVEVMDKLCFFEAQHYDVRKWGAFVRDENFPDPVVVSVFEWLRSGAQAAAAARRVAPADADVERVALPWERPELAGWRIVGMNHYHIQDGWRIYVSMTRGSACITVEGPDTIAVWDDLARAAIAAMKGA